MNDYQMSILAADRRRALLSEAQRARLVASGHRAVAGHQPARPRRTMRLGLAQLLRRVPT